MYKYNITLNSIGQLSTTVEVQANSQEEAQEKALSSISFLEWEVVDIEPSQTYVVSVENKEDPALFV